MSFYSSIDGSVILSWLIRYWKWLHVDTMWALWILPFHFICNNTNHLHPTNQRQTSISWYGEERIMGVAGGVTDVYNNAISPSNPRSRITSFVIHSFSSSLINFLNPLHFNNTFTSFIVISLSKKPVHATFHFPNVTITPVIQFCSSQLLSSSSIQSYAFQVW